MNEQDANLSEAAAGDIPDAVLPARAHNGRRHWRSLDELADDQDFFKNVGDEFTPDVEVWLDPTSRRNFLRIMGASLTLAGVVGCDDFPREKILPYVNQPESVVPGKPTFYATTFPFCGFGQGVLAESHEGRPTKIEGNPDHPASLGASHVFMQASVLDLYDPDRSKIVTHGGVPSSWGIFYQTLRQRLEQQGGKGLRLLTRSVTSPTFASQLAELQKQFPECRWHAHDPVAHAGCSARNGGAPGQAVYDFSKADVILSLDADFVFSDAGSLAYARQFTQGRRRKLGVEAGRQTMNRLYVVESTFSLTGSMADHRRAVKPSEIMQVARAVAAQLGVEAARDARAPKGLERFVEILADDLRHPRPAGDASVNGGVGLIVAGDHLPPALQTLAFAMNEALGAVGKAVHYIEPVDIQGSETLDVLLRDMMTGKVDTLLILGGNPVYDAPADLPFAKELTRLTTAVDDLGKSAFLTAHLSTHDDETSFCCQWHIPESHYLEAWGDARAYDGTASLIQPLILPLNSTGRSVPEVLEAILGRSDRGGYEIVRSVWQSQWNSAHRSQTPQTQPAQAGRGLGKDQKDAKTFDAWWQAVLQKGVIEGSAFSAKDVAGAKNLALPPASPGTPGNWELVFRPDMGVWEGQFANNPWLQELPRPFTKLVWDNAALISYRSARDLGVHDGNKVRITCDGRTLSVPVLIVPGLPDQTLTLSLGYGRNRAGHVANEEGDVVRGFNAYLLRTSIASGFAINVEVAALPGESYPLVMTRSHHAMTDLPGLTRRDESTSLKPNAIATPGTPDQETEIRNRKIVRTATLDDFRKDEDWVTKLGGETEMREKGISTEFPGRKIHLTLYPTTAKEGGWDYSTGYQWAMSIDQTSCIGCNACVIACQAENNIPVVGKDQVSRQREMHWIRIDDWFGTQPGGAQSDALENPQVTHMPVACQHCENAPCEVVCPTGATTHSAEGINEMTYNRCIGTRYCSNNCPYKVRRFNFLLYSDYTPTRALQFNPDVTVRSRGVMEKCNYCVQRLNRTRIEIEKMTVRLEERAKIIEPDSFQKAAALRSSIPRQQKDMLDQLQTACQQACPTEAIVFGNKNDPASGVTECRNDKLSYSLLADLTTQPRTTYMARLNNPHPKLTQPEGGA